MISIRQSVAAVLRAAPVCALAFSVMMPAVRHAYAQEADEAEVEADEEVLAEVTVTGSRIRRQDLESNSPLVTVDAEALESRTGLNIESYLNQLPNYNPANTPTSEAQNVQPTALTTVGISTISLRGLGSNRSLVLVDGRRATPVNAVMVTDINTIPSSMIERVESISGGESAVYGADAMGGVTNFILRKNFQGLQVDWQSGMAEVGDYTENRVSALLGTKFADGRGSIIMGGEWYRRGAALQANRRFYTDSWGDPTFSAASTRLYGTNGFIAGSGVGIPSNAAIDALLVNRSAPTLVNSTGAAASGATFNFNDGGTLWAAAGPLATSGYAGTLVRGVLREDGYALQDAYNSLQVNSANNAAAPEVSQVIKWANPTTLLSLPQTRYSFFGNGRFDLTDDIQFFVNARYAESQTRTRLSNLMSITTGWDVEIPYNQAYDSPILPGLISSATPTATLNTIANSFRAGTQVASGYANPSFRPMGTAGAQHPIPWELALLLNSRGAITSTTPVSQGGPVTCANTYVVVDIATNARINDPCGIAPAPTGAPTLSSWSLSYLPGPGDMADRSTLNTGISWQLETGFNFPLYVGNWTGEVYYSRGQSTSYQAALGNNSLQRTRAVMAAPNYGAGVSFQGNLNSTSVNFGTSVPATCTSGYYDAIFSTAVPSEDCQTAVGAILQTMTQVQQDVVELNFQGSLFDLPAGPLGAAFGYQYRRNAAQFVPDTLQSTASFLDQTVGVYPTGSLDAQAKANDVYLELLVPVVSGLPFLQRLELNLGGRLSDYDVSPSAKTYKVAGSAEITNSLRLRGGYNRATRTPNLGELFLNLQQYLGANSVYGDPCSLRSLSPFGAGNAPGVANPSASDALLPAVNGGNPTNTNGASGATSTYLICQAMMGGAGSTGSEYYYNRVAGSQAGFAGGAAIGSFQNQVGNPALDAETASTWTAGFVLRQMFDHPLLNGLSLTADWYKISIKDSIQLESSDYALFSCFGGPLVGDTATALARANSQECKEVNRSQTTGAANIIGLQYNNLGTIATSGVDVSLTWAAALDDMGLPLPGRISLGTQTSFLDYYRTKSSPLAFDVETDWRGSLGPTMSGLNAGAYSVRSYQTFTYMLPSWSVSLRWTHLPSVKPAGQATQSALIAYNEGVVADGRPQDVIRYTPSSSNKLPSYNNVGLSFNWRINERLQLRGGIDNLFDVAPPNSSTRGYGTQEEIQAACATATYGCTRPTAYSLPSQTSGGVAGYYDTIGRRFFMGVKADF